MRQFGASKFLLMFRAIARPKAVPRTGAGLEAQERGPSSPAAICARPPVQAGCSAASACRFAPEHWDEREDQTLFNTTQPTDHADDQTDGSAPASQSTSLVQRLADTEGQRIYLPRGSAQSRCEPPSYYYLASDSGAVPSWVVDEACRKRRRDGAH